MIRIYIDWNTYSYTRQKTNSTYEKIEQFLLSNQNSILTPYSPAYLQDLKGSYYRSEKGRLETISDLNYLSNLTSNYCLYYEYQDQTVYPRRFGPLSYFEEIFEDK